MPTQSNNVYPSIDELMPEPLLGIIPASLAKEITERYETLGPKYLIDEYTDDGRQINGLMVTSRIANCREEIVDAAFCILGWIFKVNHDIGYDGKARLRIHYSEHLPPDSAYEILRGLINIYSLLVAEYERDTKI